MRQHFFLLWFPGLLDLQTRGKLFLKFFTEPRLEFETRLPPGSLAASHRGFAFCVADPIGSAHESTQIDIDGFALESGALRRLGELFAFTAKTNPRGMLDISRWCKPPVSWKENSKPW
jgi:hypothetical protein